ncbi:MAG TPA: cytochrome c3 family protein [Syntrophomonadaceae bacterium]|nr:cytochrome c3 family protein [Syntrophomonadaceae bacterium]HNX29803.1 cytochrome c3 family protein [Syntrophomonadaceae bacterium]HPR94325.1 cytochrome c3 family protein [Syntrophomonadaceae bacterium]
MKSNDTEGKSFREKYLNKKVILTVISAVIVLGGITAGVLLKASEKPSFCATCHIIKPYYESWNEGVLLDNKHSREGIECLDCHHRTIPEKATEGFNFITGNYYLPLEGPPGDRKMCLDCHSETGAGISWNEIKAATEFGDSNPHNSHNGEQDCNLCHQIHEKSKPMCAECHVWSWMDDLDESWEVQ